MNVTSAKYSTSENSVIIAVIDGETWHVPNGATDNAHYEAIQDWVAEGNTIQDAD